jgi:creatinine amidohydrolase/Fe(II)-dependent formamide hydrolase-like protein
VVGFDEMRGTVTFSKALVKQILAESFENLEKLGAKVIVFLTGHYGRFQMETIAEAASEYAARSDVRIIAQAEYEGVDFSDFPCEADHADVYETSLMMALHPHLVQMDKFTGNIEIPHEYEYRENPWGFRSPKGTWTFSDDFAATASPVLGQRLLRAILDHLKGRIEEKVALVN